VAVERVEDETDYLLKSPANAMQLERARQEFEARQGIVVNNLEQLDQLLQ
jgi:PHD/YefM family antitoxin component YafN of YafNO toxin-antitoxin module